jgi:hypothetical protein
MRASIQQLDSLIRRATGVNGLHLECLTPERQELQEIYDCAAALGIAEDALWARVKKLAGDAGWSAFDRSVQRYKDALRALPAAAGPKAD